MATFVFSKTPQETAQFQANLAPLLQGGETITNIVLGPVSPTTSPVVPTLLSPVTDPLAIMSVSGGSDGVAYGYNMTVTTSARVLLVKVAISVTDQPFVPYTTQNPDAVTDLLGEIEAGKAAIGVALFQFPPQVDAAGGFITWELLDSEGTVYASGNAYEVKVNNNGLQNMVIGRCVINVPSTVPPSLLDQKYTLRYTLELPLPTGMQPPVDGLPLQNTFFYSEAISVNGLNTVPLGTAPSVEIKGAPATVSIVVDKLYDRVQVGLFWGNDTIVDYVDIPAPERTANGWYYAGVLPTQAMTESLVPYTLVWRYWMNSNAAQVFQESADFWVITPSIASAVTDIKAKINKARTTLYGTPDLLFPQSVCLTWLRRGMDYFNGHMGNFTSFTMTNARGPIREMWLMCAEFMALQSQELAEGEKAFNFSGQAISLEVDRTQAYGAMADKISGRIDNELKPFKQNLIIKGNTTGDGSADPGKLQRGAIGSVGITITPASAWGVYPALTTLGLR